MSIVTAVLLLGGWSYISTTGQRIVSDTGLIPDRRTAVEKARSDYEEKHDLVTMLAYGHALDTAMLGMDEERARLQKEFFHHLAVATGDSVGIKWTYLYGLWMRESRLNPKALGDGDYDKDGHIIPNTYRAFGTGQIHLRTALEVDPEATEEKLMDPIYNGYKSAQILKKYTDRFGGNIRYGISAYQQGPTKTNSQYLKKERPANIDYVLDVCQYAAEVNGH